MWTPSAVVLCRRTRKRFGFRYSNRLSRAAQHFPGCHIPSSSSPCRRRSSSFCRRCTTGASTPCSQPRHFDRPWSTSFRRAIAKSMSSNRQRCAPRSVVAIRATAGPRRPIFLKELVSIEPRRCKPTLALMLRSSISRRPHRSEFFASSIETVNATRARSSFHPRQFQRRVRVPVARGRGLIFERIFAALVTVLVRSAA